MKRICSACFALLMAVTCIFTAVPVFALDVSEANAQLSANGFEPLYCDSQWRDYDGQAGKRAFYKFTVTSPGKLNIKIEAYSFLEATLSSEDLSTDYFTLFSMASSQQPQTVFRNQVINAGTYYLSVSCNGRYRLNGTFGGNCSENAQVLLADTTVYGAATDYDGGWWYLIKAPSDSLYTFDVSSKSASNVTIYTSDLSGIVDDTVCSDASGNTAYSKKNIYLLKGSYYIKVESSDSYTLTWYKLTKDNCDHTYSNQYVDPTYLKKGYRIHTCTVCGYSYKDNYTAKKKLSAPSVKSLKKGSKKITVKIARVNRATGYQIQYSTSSKFTSKTTKKVSTKKLTKTLSGLKGRTKYYVRVRAYKKVDGKTVFSSWSDVSTIRTSK